MDTTAVISIIVVSLAIIMPIVYNRIQSNKKKQSSEAAFRAIAHANGLNISESERWNHYIIGIDKGSSRLIYMNKEYNNNEPLIIDLSVVKAIVIRDVSRGVDTQSGRVTVLDKLNLTLVQKGKDTLPISLEFYNSEMDATPHHEMEIITKWKKTLEFFL
jgi:hypothetical protein